MALRCASSRLTLERLNRILKRAEKTRAVLLRKGSPAALGRACFPQIAHQFAHGERHADTVLREGPTIMAERGSALFKRSRGKRNIARYHNVARTCPLGNPVIRNIRPGRHSHMRNQRMT